MSGAVSALLHSLLSRNHIAAFPKLLGSELVSKYVLISRLVLVHLSRTCRGGTKHSVLGRRVFVSGHMPLMLHRFPTITIFEPFNKLLIPTLVFEHVCFVFTIWHTSMGVIAAERSIICTAADSYIFLLNLLGHVRDFVHILRATLEICYCHL